MKTCRDCKIEKPLDDFYNSGYRRKDGTQGKKSVCKLCDNVRTIAWKENNPDKFKDNMRRANIKLCYGLEAEVYDEMIKNGCYVCGSHESLNVDHDHSCCPGKRTCGKCVRGILCRRHNWVMGNLNDSLEEVRNVENYIKTYCQRD